MNTIYENHDATAALRIAKANRDEAFLHGSLFAYLRAERKYKKLQKNPTSERRKKTNHGWRLKLSLDGVSTVRGSRHRKWFNNRVACDSGFVQVNVLTPLS